MAQGKCAEVTRNSCETLVSSVRAHTQNEKRFSLYFSFFFLFVCVRFHRVSNGSFAQSTVAVIVFFFVCVVVVSFCLVLLF